MTEVRQIAIVDQRDIQARGGVCSKAPVSCLLRDRILRNILPGRIDRKLTILDLTYGEGRFYVAFQSKVKIYAVDIARISWLVKPHMFIQSDLRSIDLSLFRDKGIELVVIDPPFPGWSGWNREHYYNITSKPEELIGYAYRYAVDLKTHLLIHNRSPVYRSGCRVLVEVFFKPMIRRADTEKYRSWFALLDCG